MTAPTTTEPVAGPIRQLPRRLYLDTQFVFAYLVEDDRDHRAATEEAERLKLLCPRYVEVFVSVLVVDELAWKLAALIYDGEKQRAGAWRSLTNQQRKQEYRGLCPKVAAVIERFLNEPWVRVIAVGDAQCRAVPDTIRQYRLCPADACHLACATHGGLGGILTNDADFRNLRDPPVEVIRYGVGH
jgi:predicted nucleic acid-binding protein